MITENNLDIDTIKSSGKDDRVTKADVINHLEDSKLKKHYVATTSKSRKQARKKSPNVTS